jgi:hypothetical protein
MNSVGRLRPDWAEAKLQRHDITERTTAKVRMATRNEQAVAACLRVAWMGEIEHGAQEIEASLRYYRPQSVAEEQDFLDVVRKQIEGERRCTGDPG